MSRKSPQIRKLTNDLADTLYGEAIAAATGKSLEPYRRKAQEICDRLGRQGVTPIERMLLVEEMREDAQRLTKALA